jgi:membrane protein YqaA with SNARE-associated domain
LLFFDAAFADATIFAISLDAAISAYCRLSPFSLLFFRLAAAAASAMRDAIRR